MSVRVADSVSTFKKSNKLFKNPHKGFTTFQRHKGDKLNENWSVQTGWMMEQLPDTEGLYIGEVENFPDTTIAYFRLPWCRIERKEGEYDLDYIDDILETAEKRGQKVMFRFIPHAARPGCLDLPEWFREKLGIPEREVGDKASPDHPLFYELFAKFIRKMGEHIDGDRRVTAIDMALVSAWGEQDGIENLSEEKWKFLVDAYMQSFKKTPVSAQFNHTESIDYANTYRPIGARADCLGDMKWHMFALYPKFFDNSTLWKKAPIAFEVCWVVKHWLDMGWNIDHTIEQSLKWHITSFNAKSVAIPPELKEKCEEWIKRMGYRYSVNKVEYPSVAEKGDSLEITLHIENSGVAPIYHEYPFVLRLKGEKIYTFNTEIDLREILPGEYIFKETLDLPIDIEAGEYVLEAGIGDDEDRVYIATDSPENNGYNTISSIIKIS